MRRLPAFSLALAISLAACERIDTPTAPKSEPSFLIQDANNNDGNEHFFWVPPTIQGPVNAGGVFDATMEVVVEVCEWSGTECLVTISEFTLGDGLALNPVDERYEAHFDAGLAEAGKTYRAEAFAYGQSLGLVDIQRAASPNEFHNISRDEYIPLQTKSNKPHVPLFFRVEEGAVALPPGMAYNPLNGHYYEAIGEPSPSSFSFTWYEAQAASESRSYAGCPGHLATITSLEEQEFILSAFPQVSQAYWWIGALQPPGSPEPAGGWAWVTGEPFSFTYWLAGEPNNAYGGTEDGIHIHNNGYWNDAPRTLAYGGYIVEYGTACP